MKELPKGWVEVQLSEFCEVIQGQSPPSETYNREGRGLPFFQGKADFGPVHPITRVWCHQPNKIAEAGDVLISIRAPVGPTNIADQRCAIGRGLAAIRPLGQIESPFVLHALRYREHELQSVATGSTFTAISGAQLRELKIPLPPLAEQRRIVAEIEKQFTRLDVANENLIWARRKLSLLSRLAFDKVQPTKRQDGTRWVCLRSVAELIQYGSSAKASSEFKAVPIIRMGNISSDGRLLLANLKYLPADHDEFPKLLLKTGDVLFNRTNSVELVGKSAVYQGNPSPCTFASYLIRVRTGEECLPEFLAASLNSPRGRRWISSVVSQQVGQANVNGTKLANFEFHLPSRAEQRRLMSKFEEIMSVIWTMESSLADSSARAARLRAAILAKAFSGQLVPQDPNDEPASVLLERIRRERSASAAAPKPSRKRKRNVT